MIPAPKKIACLKFVGVMTTNTLYADVNRIYDPLPGLQKFIGDLLFAGFKVVVYTEQVGVNAVVHWIQTHGITGVSEVLDKKPKAEVYIDDCAVQFTGDYDAIVAQAIGFAPWWANKKAAKAKK